MDARLRGLRDMVRAITGKRHMGRGNARNWHLDPGKLMALLSADSNNEKITQAYCQYGPGSPQANCGICHHYTGNGCEIVQDPIRPEMVCRFFCPKQGGGLLGGGASQASVGGGGYPS